MDKEQIQARLKELLSDERLVTYPSANIFSNAPLCLIQVAGETEVHTLQRVIGEPLTDFKKLRGE